MDPWSCPYIYFSYLIRCLTFSGSVLVAAAHRGAYVWGWDIDYLTLHARTKPTRHSQVCDGIAVVKVPTVFLCLRILLNYREDSEQKLFAETTCC